MRVVGTANQMLGLGPGKGGDPGLATSIERAAGEAYLCFLGCSNKCVQVRTRVLVGQVDTCYGEWLFEMEARVTSLGPVWQYLADCVDNKGR